MLRGHPKLMPTCWRRKWRVRNGDGGLASWSKTMESSRGGGLDAARAPDVVDNELDVSRRVENSDGELARGGLSAARAPDVVENELNVRQRRRRLGNGGGELAGVL